MQLPSTPLPPPALPAPPSSLSPFVPQGKPRSDPEEEAAAGPGSPCRAGSAGAGVCGTAGRRALPHAIKLPGCLACSSTVSTVLPDPHLHGSTCSPAPSRFPSQPHPPALELQAQTLAKPGDPMPGMWGAGLLMVASGPSQPLAPGFQPSLPQQAAGAVAPALRAAARSRAAPWCETSLLDTAPSLVHGGPVDTVPGTALAEHLNPLTPSSVPGESVAGGCRSRCCSGGGMGCGCSSQCQPLLLLPAGLQAGAEGLCPSLLGAIPQRQPSPVPLLGASMFPLPSGAGPGLSVGSGCRVQLGQVQKQLPWGWHRPCLAPLPAHQGPAGLPQKRLLSALISSY